MCVYKQSCLSLCLRGSVNQFGIKSCWDRVEPQMTGFIKAVFHKKIKLQEKLSLLAVALQKPGHSKGSPLQLWIFIAKIPFSFPITKTIPPLMLCLIKYVPVLRVLNMVFRKLQCSSNYWEIKHCVHPKTITASDLHELKSTMAWVLPLLDTFAIRYWTN